MKRIVLIAVGVLALSISVVTTPVDAAEIARVIGKQIKVYDAENGSQVGAIDKKDKASFSDLALTAKGWIAAKHPKFDGVIYLNPKRVRTKGLLSKGRDCIKGEQIASAGQRGASGGCK
ncbi:MAG: hypothetical protein ISP41_01035 [Alphaproteobacteria bacterium]|nr:hypothetical protein [Alphaproteobacteria bacterium]